MNEHIYILIECGLHECRVFKNKSRDALIKEAVENYGIDGCDRSKLDDGNALELLHANLFIKEI